MDVQRLAPHVGGDLVAEVVQHIAEHHLGALAHEATDLGRALSAGAPCDDRHLPIESAHRCTSCVVSFSRPSRVASLALVVLDPSLSPACRTTWAPRRSPVDTFRTI